MQCEELKVCIARENEKRTGIKVERLMSAEKILR